MCSIVLFFIISIIFIIISGSDSIDEDPSGPLFLTKYIENGDIEKAQGLARVTEPEGYLVESFAGLLTVNETYNSNLYFWFFPAEINPNEAPVVLWLNGGPGAPSLYSTVTENGPYGLDELGKLIPAENSWHLNHNLLYIDSPVGTGYSFTDSEYGYSKNQVDVGQNMVIALQQFFALFPDLQKNELYVNSVSFGGKYVPAVGHAIYQDSKRDTTDRQTPKINLKGMTIGNGLFDPINQIDYGDYMYDLGLIDSHGRKLVEQKRNKCIECIKRKDFACALNEFDELFLGYYFPYNTLYTNLTGLTKYINFLEPIDTVLRESRSSSFMEFFSNPEIQHALHAGNIYFDFPFVLRDETFRNLVVDMMDSVVDWVVELLPHYEILFYHGQLDIISAYSITENLLRNLSFSGSEQYETAERQIWRVDNEVAGYAKRIGNLTEILVRDAGHSAGQDQPKWILDMLTRFTRHKTFDD